MKIISIISANENINIEIKYIIKRHKFKSINYFQFTDFKSRSMEGMNEMIVRLVSVHLTTYVR